MSTENRIHQIGEFLREEKLAAAELYPGHLIEETSAGKFQKHSTAQGVAERIVAVEDALQGNTISTAYAADALVSANIETPGNQVQMFLKAGENVAIGAKLESAGDGTLQAVTTGTVIAVAVEAKDLSASGAVATLMSVRFV